MKKPVYHVLFFVLFISAENPISINTKLHIKDQAGRAIESGYVNVDNPEKDGSNIIDGVAQFIIRDYPTGIEDIKGVENVIIDYYTITGQQIHSAQGTVTRDGNKLRVKPNTIKDASSQILLAHVRGNHFQKTEKILSGTNMFYLQGEANTSNGGLKSALDESVHAPATKRLSFTKQEPIILKGKTFIIGKYADSRFYHADNEEYINSRKEPYMTFALTNLLGDTLMTIISDANAEYEVELQKKEPHYYMIAPGNTHEALVQILIDSTENIKNVGAANNKGDNAMSRADNMQLHMAYSNIDGDDEIDPPPENSLYKPKTMNWKQYYFDEGFDFIFVDSIYDFQNNMFIKEMTQTFKDTIHDSRNTVNKFTNDFFKNGTESWQSDFSRAGEHGVILTMGTRTKILQEV